MAQAQPRLKVSSKEAEAVRKPGSVVDSHSSGMHVAMHF